MRLSMSSRSPPVGTFGSCRGGAGGQPGRTAFGWPAAGIESDEFPTIMDQVYRILFMNIAIFPRKMHHELTDGTRLSVEHPTPERTGTKGSVP
jgi:hypothetical protein